MGVVSKGDVCHLFIIVVLEHLRSGGEGLFRGAEREFDGDYFQLIGQKGLFEYYAYVLPSQSELAITQQELTGEMFFFLD